MPTPPRGVPAPTTALPTRGNPTRGCHAAPKGHFGPCQSREKPQRSSSAAHTCSQLVLRPPGMQKFPRDRALPPPSPRPRCAPCAPSPSSPSSILLSSPSPALSAALVPLLAAPAPSPAGRGPSAVPWGRLAERFPSPGGSGPPSRRGALERGSDCSECRVSHVFFSLVWLLGGHGKRPPAMPTVGSKALGTPGHPWQPGVGHRQPEEGSGLPRAAG